MGYGIRKGYRFDRATHPQRAASIFFDENLGLWVLIAEQSGVMTQASALSAEGQHV